MLKGVLKQRRSHAQGPGREKGKVCEAAVQGDPTGGCGTRVVGQGGYQKGGVKGGEQVLQGLGMLG